MLVLATGAIAACDPLTTSRPLAFVRRVHPGRYPVELILQSSRGDVRVALSRVRVAEGRPTRWELAVQQGQDPRTLAPGERFGYGVDAGIGCFADPAGLSAYLELRDRLAVLEDQGPTWSVGVFEQDGGSAVLFSSGYGDGFYSSWWGVDDAGEPLVLVTDFGVLDVDWPELPDDPDHRRRHADAQLARLQRALPELVAAPDGPARAEAYNAAAQLATRAGDQPQLTRAIVDLLLQWSDVDQAVDCIAVAAIACFVPDDMQSQLVELLARCSATQRSRILRKLVRRLRWQEISAPLAAALLAAARADSTLWEPVLTLVSTARRGREPFHEAARQVVEADFPRRISAAAPADRLRGALGKVSRLVLAAIRVLGDVEPLPEATLASLQVLLVEFGDGPWREPAAKLLAQRDPDRLRSLLESPVPRLRLWCASLLRAHPDHGAAAITTLRSLAADASLPAEEIRTAAVADLPDRDERIAALGPLAIEGSYLALAHLVHLRSAPEAVAWLERIAAEARHPTIVAEARRRLAGARARADEPA